MLFLMMMKRRNLQGKFLLPLRKVKLKLKLRHLKISSVFIAMKKVIRRLSVLNFAVACAKNKGIVQMIVLTLVLQHQNLKRNDYLMMKAVKGYFLLVLSSKENY